MKGNENGEQLLWKLNGIYSTEMAESVSTALISSAKKECENVREERLQKIT